ncbi:bidirectional sugar transporter SWEET4 [Malania oleifera]|uniref:bidirectional sugar transporter SWEET4 n=1 Tax=Malania oleifera TaxID=397392 RepID=UPI0025AEA612|nr:bidirectional sugar transporter SWEET4 [Malania oleifera]
MVSAEGARTAVGILGNIISLFLFLSPVPTFIHIWKKGSVEQYSPVPYLAALVNCMIWVMYGLPMVHPHSFLVLTINGAGLVIELTYLLLFLFYSGDQRERLKVVAAMLAEVVFIVAVALLVLTLAHTEARRSMVVGTLCILFNVMMYASPLFVIKLVIRTKSVEYMPFFISFASFANGVSWASYALIRFDPFIIIPNGLGSVFALAQLVLYATYYKSTQKQLAERKSRGEMGLAHVTVAEDSQHSTKVGTAELQNGHV